MEKEFYTQTSNIRSTPSSQRLTYLSVKTRYYKSMTYFKIFKRYDFTVHPSQTDHFQYYL